MPRQDHPNERNDDDRRTAPAGHRAGHDGCLPRTREPGRPRADAGPAGGAGGRGCPASSYLLNLGAAADVGLTLEDVQGVLIAIAPIVGSPKVLTAAGTITAALGIALAIDDALTDGADDND